MFTRPSSDELLEGCIIALQNDILPNLSTQKAQVTATMMQALLQEVRQRLPVEQQIMASERNEMLALLRELPGHLDGAHGDAAARIHQRANECGSYPDAEPIPAFEDNVAIYRELSQALEQTVDDLHELVNAGHEGAQAALARLREHLAKRTATDFATLVVGAGMAGRG